jgi:hypothetical protein
MLANNVEFLFGSHGGVEGLFTITEGGVEDIKGVRGCGWGCKEDSGEGLDIL